MFGILTLAGLSFIVACIAATIGERYEWRFTRLQDSKDRNLEFFFKALAILLCFIGFGLLISITFL